MIKIDYLIRRDEGDQIIDYQPNQIPSDLPILSYIQGPNASGKSTLLNIIALAFFGLKSSKEELNPDLKNRIAALVNSSHQKLKFKIEIENEKLGVQFKLEKKELDNESITVRKIENGKDIPISEDLFKREYKLVYDIPNDPLGRLPLLLYSLRDQQKDISADITDFRDQLRTIIQQIKDCRDPELLSKLRNRIKENESLLNDSKEKEKMLEKKYLNLLEYRFARFMSFYQTEILELNKRVRDLQKEANEERRVQNRNLKLYMDLSENLSIRIQQIEEIFDHITEVLPAFLEKDQQINYQILRKGDIHNEIHNPEIYKSIRDESEYFAHYFSNFTLSERIKLSNDLEKKRLLKSLVAILLDYQDNKITIPGINLSIIEFITSLKNELNDLENITSKLDNIEKCTHLFEQLMKMMDEGIKIASQINDKKDFNEEEIVALQLHQDIEIKQKRIDSLSKVLTELRTGAIQDQFNPDDLINRYPVIKEDIELSLYNILDEKQIIEKVIDLETKFKSIKDTNRKLDRKLEDMKEELSQLESRQPHKYQDSFDSIQRLLTHIQHLEILFHSFDSWLYQLIENPETMIDVTPRQSEYTERVGNYLGKKIGRILYGLENYDVKNINVVSKIVNTENGKIIHFSDLSTGQGQGAYLDGLLNMHENRKIVALFDEVAMMDDQTLKPIMEKLRNLYNEKKLLLAIIVQKSNDVKIKDISCELL